MSGFSAEWLALREAADHRARNAVLAEQLREYFAGRETVRVVDLGCGTGSNLRALAPLLPDSQHWRLIDYDPALLEEAERQIEAWLAGTGTSGISIGFETTDLSGDLERVLTREYNIVTAAALFDLVSERWIDQFVSLVTKRRHAFYTVLIYDGVMSWQPPHPADEAIRAAFNIHQHQDKGFGLAAGPAASRLLSERLENAGYRVLTAPSPWRLTRDELHLILATAEGVSRAVRETGLVPDRDVAEWLDTRPLLLSCEIGHIDLLALPQ